MFEPNDEFELFVLTDIGPDKRSAVVIDHFYKNPDEVRELCLSLPQITKDDDPSFVAGLPGNRIFLKTDEVANHLKQIFHSLCFDLPIWKHKINETIFEKEWEWRGFTCNVVNEQTLLDYPRGIIPHQDYYSQENPIEERAQFGCVIYLNTPEECKGGTNLYSYQGKMSLPVSDHHNLYSFDEEEQIPKRLLFEMIKSRLEHSSDWKVEKHFPMRYNRCVLYEADVLHGAIFDLGMFKDYSRINQVLFM